MDVVLFLTIALTAVIISGAAIIIALIWRDAQLIKRTFITQEKELIKEESKKTNEELEQELNETPRVIAMDEVIKSANELMGIQTEEKEDK